MVIISKNYGNSALSPRDFFFFFFFTVVVTHSSMEVPPRPDSDQFLRSDKTGHIQRGMNIERSYAFSSRLHMLIAFMFSQQDFPASCFWALSSSSSRFLTYSGKVFLFYQVYISLFAYICISFCSEKLSYFSVVSLLLLIIHVQSIFLKTNFPTLTYKAINPLPSIQLHAAG